MARSERRRGTDERGVDVAQCVTCRIRDGRGEEAGEGVDEVVRMYCVWQQRPTVVAGALTVGANGHCEGQRARETVAAHRLGNVGESSGELLENAVGRRVRGQVQEDVGSSVVLEHRDEGLVVA